MSRIDGVVARLHGLHPRLIDLSLDRLLSLLTRLDDPHCRLPPVIHVAGTNGKGSTCAFLRAMAEAAGWRAHVYTSPHLVRFNERIRVAGALVDDVALADTLERIEGVNAGAAITVFEVITAAAFDLFARAPAEVCIVEVGLGGRGDATNVVTPAASAITSVSLDHQEFLGGTLAEIAAEKAGICKPGVPVVVGAQDGAAMESIRRIAERAGAPMLVRDRDWHVERTAGGLLYADARGRLETPPPSLAGSHQVDNAGIAIAVMRAAGVGLPAEAVAAGVGRAAWPARMQRLDGRLAALLPEGWELWLDGGHNPGAGVVLAEHLGGWRDRPVHLLVGMKESKDSAAFLAPLLPHAETVWAVAEPDQHLAMPVERIVAASGGIARVGPTVGSALRRLAGRPARVLICGSLYLAGEVLKMD